MIHGAGAGRLIPDTTGIQCPAKWKIHGKAALADKGACGKRVRKRVRLPGSGTFP